MDKEFDVIIIGGGITGAGTARDCALRGLRVLLIERGDIANGATGRNHGLLHSGARYAVNDPESAAECISENKILRKIAPHCVEDTQGLFITLPEDCDSGFGLDYQKKFIDACSRSGIDARAIDPREAIRMEPSVNPDLIGAVKVPDGSVDPFRLCASNVFDAVLHEAQVLSYTEVTGLIIHAGHVTGVNTRNKMTGDEKSYHGNIIVNAAGIWGQTIAEMAGVRIGMYPAKGTLLIFAHRVNGTVINRCRKASDGDILVPGQTVSVIGTTSTKVPYGECDHVHPTADEVGILLREGCKLCPTLGSTRLLRAYSGVRPLIASDDDPTGRSISRGIVCIDHEKRDGLKGFVTITGGKLMTYRLMAEKVTDLVCSKLGLHETCRTACTQLPDSLAQPKDADPLDNRLVCECENVTMGVIKSAIARLNINTLEDLRRRTRVGMGTCQGTYCIHKAAKALSEAKGDPDSAGRLTADYLDERWKGMVPVGWGDTIREMEFMQKVYKVRKPTTFNKL